MSRRRTRLPSAHRRRDHRAALGPERIDAAAELERRALAEIALEALAVIADLLDDVVGPLLVEAEDLAVAVDHAQEALHVEVGRRQRVIDGRLVDAALLRLEHGVLGPAHHVEPSRIAVTNVR